MRPHLRHREFLLTASTLATPVAAAAQVLTACDIIGILNRAGAYLTSVILVIAVAVLLWTAILFITGGGNEEKIKEAKVFLIYVLVGLAIALLSTQADDIVKNLFGSEFVSSC